MLSEVEFELSAEQFALMGYPRLTQGQPLSVILDAGVLLPDPAAHAWFVVQKEPLAPAFAQVGRARYAFTGQIEEAEIIKESELETATLLIRAGEVLFRAICAPDDEGRLPFGTWETRTITGVAPMHGIVEDDFSSAIGSPVGVTIWSFRRLILAPGDPHFGVWHASDELPDSPFRYDQIVVEGRLHRTRQ
jgi:hypothetical protein